MRRRLLPLVLAALLLGAGLYAFSQHGGSDDNSDGDDDTEAATTTETSPGDTGDVSGEAGDGGERVTVTTVHDGDSFIAKLPGGGESEVRLIGINAPDQYECMHHPARKALTELLRSGPITLQQDVTDRDRYDRLLRYVLVGETVVNVDMAERGLALAVSTGPDDARRGEIHAAQQRARAAKLGIWRVDACGAPASTAVAIVNVEADPKGRDDENLNGEYAVIRNAGGTPVDMTGWKLRDDSTQNRYWFPKGYALGAGRQVTVHVGGGTDTADALYWGRRFPIWDNFGDMALLLDPRGNVVSYQDVAPTRT